MHWTEYNGKYPHGYIVPADQNPATYSEYGKRHGPAVIHYFLDRGIGAENVLLPDGSRSKVQGTLRYWSGWRRPLNAPDQAWVGETARIPVRWQWGTLALSDNDVSFVDGPSPAAEVEEDDGAPVLGTELCASREFQEVVSSFDDAILLFTFLRDFSFVRQSDGLVQNTSGTGEAAQLVADIRGIGEYYIDFKFLGDVQLTDPAGAEQRVEDALKNLGWGGSFEREVRRRKTAAVLAKIRDKHPDITGFVGSVTLDDGEEVFAAWQKKGDGE
jgi:hypothetical protein